MSLNALEVLSSRIAKRKVSFSEGDQFIGRGPLHEFELRLSEYPPYHSPEWWDMMWKKHEEWRLETYPPAVDTDGYECTPPTGEILAS